MAPSLQGTSPQGVIVTEGPSSEEWNAIKGIFIELYVHQGRKLAEIQYLLAHQFNFHATEKSYKRRIAQWKAYKNYKSADKKALADTVSSSNTGSDVPTSAQIHGNPIKWDTIRRTTRAAGTKRPRKAPAAYHIEQRIQLNLHPTSLRPAVSVAEKILFLTKTYLDWNIATWTPLGLSKPVPGAEMSRKGGRSPEKSASRLFNQCFYNAIPFLLTNRTTEAFEQISLGCSLAVHCFKHSPYWVFLRLLRLHSYPLWDRFPDVRRQIISFLQALAGRTLPKAHMLRSLLALWAREYGEAEAGCIASLLRLCSDTFGPASGLEPDEWAWIQDEICSLSYQKRELHDVVRIARRLADDENVPRGVHIVSQQTLARCHLHYGEIDQAADTLFATLSKCMECDTDDEQARHLQQTYSDLGYVFHIRQNHTRSLQFYEQALERAVQVDKNSANIASLRCRVEFLTAHEHASPQDLEASTHGSRWALWAFCRPYS